jgi:hypothetical protein
LRAAGWAAWTRTLAWRIATTVGVGGESLAACWYSGSAWWLARSRPWQLAGGCGSSPAQTPSLGRRGAAGERRTARLLSPLERQGWAVLHDLAVHGSRANLDHLVIGPVGCS